MPPEDNPADDITDDEYWRAMADADDSTPLCEDCGERMIQDFMGDPDVIGGTFNFWTCPKCEA